LIPNSPAAWLTPVEHRVSADLPWASTKAGWYRGIWDLHMTHVPDTPGCCCIAGCHKFSKSCLFFGTNVMHLDDIAGYSSGFWGFTSLFYIASVIMFGLHGIQHPTDHFSGHFLF
jgi:hypothetical protein